MIKAEIVADSINQFDKRITTMVVTFPRIILAEFNTHRMFSRNSASSRAIPFEKMVKSVEENPFIPLAWQIDHKGMQGTEYLTSPIDIAYAHDLWLEGAKSAVKAAKNLKVSVNLTKQLCNRGLEAYTYHTVIVTATEWENFFALRCPQYQADSASPVYRSRKDWCNSVQGTRVSDYTELEWLKINKGQAEIHMMALAEAMWDAMNESTPELLKAGEYHIPFKKKFLKEGEYPDDLFTIDELIKISTVQSARTSYTVVGEDQKVLTFNRIYKIHDDLVSANPLHASPMEHCAEVGAENVSSGNFTGGWLQYRKRFPNENITK